MRPWIEPSAGWARAASWQGKIGFETQARARSTIKRAIRSDRRHCERGARLAAYKCRHCAAWHIGNTWKKPT